MSKNTKLLALIIIVVGILTTTIYFFGFKSKPIQPKPEEGNTKIETSVSGAIKDVKPGIQKNIESGVSEDFTKALSSGRITDCNKLSPGIKESCEQQLISGFSVEKCTTLTDVQLKNTCIDNANYENALETKSSGTCSFIKDKVKQMECYSFLSGIKSCGLLSGGAKISCEDRYNYETALSKKDKTLCYNIANLTTRKDCSTTLGK